MAGSFGWKFILFTLVFYGFIGMLFLFGAGDYFTASLPNTNFNLNTNISVLGFDTGIPNPFNNFITLITNPFSGYNFISWLSIAFALVDLYILATSLIP